MKCELSLDINTCPFYDATNRECKNNDKCSFQEHESEKSKEMYIRKERWYENIIGSDMIYESNCI